MTAVPEAATATASAIATAEISVPPSSLLLSDEAFLEPATTGELLPNGRNRYLEWVKNRKEGMEQRGKPSLSISGQLCDSDSDSETDDHIYTLQATSFATTMLPFSDKEALEKFKPSRVGVVNAFLRTFEAFPAKYLVDSDDESGGEEDKPEDRSTSTPTTTLTRSSKRKKSRKSVLFSSERSQSIGEDQIAMPPNASGIVGVMGRRIHADRLINGNASLYSMLRAWVQDDPESTIYHATTVAETTAHAGVSRKTLKDYKKQSSSREKPPGPLLGGLTKRSDKPPRRVDLLGWLSTDPKLRPLTPCYPTMEETMEIRQKRTDKRAARILRKRRLAAARESLRRKGIKV